MTLSRPLPLATVSLALVLAGAWIAAAPGARQTTPARARALSAGLSAQGKITHVVVIVQENRTFDNLFGGYPHAGPLGPVAYPHADSTYPPRIVQLGIMKSTRLDDGSGDNHHYSYACLNQPLPETARFSTDRWILVSKHAVPPHVCKNTGNDYSFFRYVPQSQRAIYWEIAKKYGLGDRFWAATSSASFPPHQFIVAGDVFFTLPNASGSSSTYYVADQPPWFAHGCFDIPPATPISVPVVGPDVFPVNVKAPGKLGACYPRTTYADRLDAKKISWRHYSTFLPNETSAEPVSQIHAFNGFTNIEHWYEHTVPLPTAHFRRTTQILKDANATEGFPAFAWVKPPCIKQSDHPGAHGHNGPNWVGSVINAIGNSSHWKSTVIFVIWDDWGGFYDHVVPPVPPRAARELGRGVRIPFLVISPYLIQPGEVVHTEGHPGSIMRFVDDLYGLEPLTAFDAQAPDLAGWFDFTQPPRDFVPIAGAQGSGMWDDSMCDGSSAAMDD